MAVILLPLLELVIFTEINKTEWFYKVIIAVYFIQNTILLAVLKTLFWTGYILIYEKLKVVSTMTIVCVVSMHEKKGKGWKGDRAFKIKNIVD